MFHQTLLRQRDHLKAAVRHDDAVIIPALDLPQHLLPELGPKGRRVHRQHLGRRIHLLEDQLPLAHDMVGHHKQVFPGLPLLAHFHSGSDHNVGLPRPHVKSQQRVFFRDHPHDGVLLVVKQRDIRAHFREVQFPAAVFFGPAALKELVVCLLDFPAAVLVLPDPLLEQLFDGLLLFQRRHRLLLRLPPDLPEIQRGFQNIQRAVVRQAVGAPDPRLVRAPVPTLLVLHMPVSGQGLVADILAGRVILARKRLTSRAEKISEIVDDPFPDPRHAQRDLNIRIGDVVGRPWSRLRLHEAKFLLLLASLQLLCLGIQRNPLVQGHLSEILFGQGVHDLRRRQAVHRDGTAPGPLRSAEMERIVFRVKLRIVPAHQLIGHMPLNLRLVHELHNLVDDVLLAFIGVQREAGFDQQVGQLQFPEGAQLAGAVRVPSVGGAVDNDMVALNGDDPPVAGHLLLRRLEVAAADDDIALLKKAVVGLYLTTQPLVIVQIAFDLVARQAVCHRHQVAHRVADAFFLIDPDLTVGCPQIGNQDILDFLSVHAGLPVIVISERSTQVECHSEYACAYSFGKCALYHAALSAGIAKAAAQYAFGDSFIILLQELMNHSGIPFCVRTEIHSLSSSSSESESISLTNVTSNPASSRRQKTSSMLPMISLNGTAFFFTSSSPLSSQTPQEWRRAKTLMMSFIVWGSASLQIAWISENLSSGIFV